MPKKFLVAVLTEPAEGKEAEFHDYYENTHLDEVIETTGWKTAQRFRLAVETGAPCPLPYLAVYEAEDESAEAVMSRLVDTRPERQQTDAINMKTAGIWIYEATGPKHEA